MSNHALRKLCIENNWFTFGDNDQYNKLFKLNKQGASVEELALVIWLCSDDDEWNRTEIECKLRERINREV